MLRSLNSGLCLAVMALLGIGVVQVYSSSYIFAIESFGDGLFFFKKQLVFAILAFFVLLATMKIPLKYIENWGWVFWILATIGIIGTFVPGLGVRGGGAARWLQLPFGLRFEPGELLKISSVMVFSSLLAKEDNFLRRMHWGFLLAMLAVPMLLLLKQPDFGTFAIVMCVGLGMLFAFGLKWRFILGAMTFVIPVFYFLVMNVPYRRARILAFLDPWADPEQKGFQVIQSMLSFRSGGLFGAGLGQGQGKLFFLPEAHTDFTLAVFAEEMGFIGVLFVLLLYGFVAFRGFQIAFKTDDPFKRAIAAGFSMVFALTVFINAGVVMGLLPTKGLALPFLSYGGSSLVTLCFMFGILLSVEKSVEDDKGSLHVTLHRP